MPPQPHTYTRSQRSTRKAVGERLVARTGFCGEAGEPNTVASKLVPRFASSFWINWVPPNVPYRPGEVGNGPVVWPSRYTPPSVPSCRKYAWS